MNCRIFTGIGTRDKLFWKKEIGMDPHQYLFIYISLCTNTCFLIRRISKIS